MTTTIVPYAGTVPARNQLQDDFDENADDWIAWVTGELAPKVNTIAGEINTSAAAAAASASAAAASAAQAQGYTGATMWVSGASYTAGTSCVWSPTNFQTYRRKTTGSAGTTDPGSGGAGVNADPTNWEPITANLLNGPIIYYPNLIALRTTAQPFSGTTPSLDLQAGDYFYGTNTSGLTFSFTHWPASGQVGGGVIEITNPGAAAINLPAGSSWWNGTGVAPVLPASGKAYLGFISRDAGATINWFLLGKS